MPYVIQDYFIATNLKKKKKKNVVFVDFADSFFFKIFNSVGFNCLLLLLEVLTKV